MQKNNGVVFSGQGTDAFVELSSRRGVAPQGRLFRKQLLHFGEFAHPNVKGKKIKVDQAFAEHLVANFSNGACDIVQVPIVDDKNKHSEDPLRNVGEVIDLDYDDKGVYAYIDARKPEYASELGRTLIGASAMMDLDYTDTRTGEKVGPTLLHAAITNRPYITNLDPYSEIIAASADTQSDGGDVVLLTEPEQDPEENTMTKDEMIAALKAEHDIDVEALMLSAASADGVDLTALSNVVGTDGEALTLNDVAEAMLELSNQSDEQKKVIEALVEKNQTLELSAATAEVDELISAGRILPKQKDSMLKLSMSDRETFEALLPEESIVSLSEDGVTTHTSTNKVEDEIKRLAALANGTKSE